MKFVILFATLVAVASANYAPLGYPSVGYTTSLVHGGYGYAAPLAYAPVAKIAAIPAVTSITHRYDSPAKILTAPVITKYAAAPLIAGPVLVGHGGGYGHY